MLVCMLTFHNWHHDAASAGVFLEPRSIFKLASAQVVRPFRLAFRPCAVMRGVQINVATALSVLMESLRVCSGGAQQS